MFYDPRRIHASLAGPISFLLASRKDGEGDREEFSRLYLRFRKPILRHVRDRVSDESTAEELTQEIFLKAYRFRSTYESTHAFSTWLWTIAKNTLIDHFRGGKSAALEAGTPVEELPSGESCAESLLLRKDQRRSLFGLLKKLTRLQRKVIWLRVVHQLSFPEIADRLGLSLSAVKNLAHRARAALSAELELGPILA